MIKYIILIAAAAMGASKVMLQGRLTRTILSNTADFALYNAIVAFGIGAVYVLQNGLSIPGGRVLVYALMHSIFSSLFQLMYTVALKNGPISISALLSNFSVGFTVLFGLIYYHDTLTAVDLIGFVFLAASLILSADLKNAFRQKISIKWLAAAMLAAVGNGASTITVTLFGKEFGTENNPAFLTIAYLMSGLMLLACSGLLGLKNKRTVKLNVKNTLSILSVAAVLCLYLPVMLQGVRLFPSTVYFPVLNAAIVSFVTVGGLLIFRDRLKKSQLLGLVLGLAAIIMLAV